MDISMKYFYKYYYLIVDMVEKPTQLLGWVIKPVCRSGEGELFKSQDLVTIYVKHFENISAKRVDFSTVVLVTSSNQFQACFCNTKHLLFMF